MQLLRGRVASGKGDLARWMALYASAYERATGLDLYPGSLNVLLDEPWPLPVVRLRLPATETGVGVNLVPCRFRERGAFVFRTDGDEADGATSQRTLEIVSDVHLRSTCGLADGDEVEVEVLA